MSEYDDIINLPHYHYPKKPCMSMRDRAGQFAPYKSLNGYYEEIGESEREILRADLPDIDFDRGLLEF